VIIGDGSFNVCHNLIKGAHSFRSTKAEPKVPLLASTIARIKATKGPNYAGPNDHRLYADGIKAKEEWINIAGG
jgi:hypothetical protein